MSDDGDVIARIRKILALAGDAGATEGERAAAAEAATRLMTRYRIEQAQIDAAGDGPRRPVDIVAEDCGDFDEHEYWALDLLTAIGSIVTVDAVFLEDRHERVRSVTLIGRADTVAWTRLIYDWVRPQITADAEVIVQAEASYQRFMQRLIPGTPIGDSHLRSYREGFYGGVTARLHERLDEAQRDAAGQHGTALVLSDRAALNDYYGDDAPTRIDTTAERRMHHEALQSGYRAGDRVDLRPHGRVDGGHGALSRGD